MELHNYLFKWIILNGKSSEGILFDSGGTIGRDQTLVSVREDFRQDIILELRFENEKA